MARSRYNRSCIRFVFFQQGAGGFFEGATAPSKKPMVRSRDKNTCSKKLFSDFLLHLRGTNLIQLILELLTDQISYCEVHAIAKMVLQLTNRIKDPVIFNFNAPRMGLLL